MRPRQGEPIEEFVAAIPEGVRIRVRRWTYNSQLAWAGWLLLAVTFGWISAFLIDIVFGSLRVGWFVAAAGLFSCWAIWAAVSIRKKTLAPYLSFYFVSLTGLLLTLVTFWPRAHESVLSQLFGDGLITGSIATLVFLFWAERAMPRINRMPDNTQV
jgi:hypothetical protein